MLMQTRSMGPRRERRRGSAGGGRRGVGRGAGRGTGLPGSRVVGAPGDEKSLATRTALRAAIAAGTCVVQDMRDRDGLTRPMLRRAALRMAVCAQPALRRIGSAYLRSDPPAPEELPAPAQSIPVTASQPLELPAAPAQAGTVIEAGRAASTAV